MTGITAARVSFAESSELLRELVELRIDPKQVECTAEALGREISDDERQVIETEPNCAATLFLGMDGTGIPVRRGKQPDGSGKTHEVKLATVWNAGKREPHNLPVCDSDSVSYSAAIESARTKDTDKALSGFAQRVEREAQRRGFHKAECQVFIGDGVK